MIVTQRRALQSQQLITLLLSSIITYSIVCDSKSTGSVPRVYQAESPTEKKKNKKKKDTEDDAAGITAKLSIKNGC